jgi:GRIP and coiled-coil domain-containing protein 2
MSECQEDNKRLTEKIQQMEAQKMADKDCLKAMQEIVDSLTQHKLEATTQLQEAKQTNTKLLDTINDMQLNQSDTEELAIENEALKRQVKRLTDENEELFADLQSSTEQKATDNSSGVVDDDLNQQIAELQRQIATLENDRKAANEKYEAENCALREKSANFDKQFKELLAKSDASTKKLNLYKTKLIEISNKLKALKTTKKVLLEVVKDYAQTIPKWQKEILNASNKVFEKLTMYEKENRRLKAEIEEVSVRIKKNLEFETIFNFFLSFEISNHKVVKRKR